MTIQKEGDRYIAVSQYEERLIPKAAGFRWNPERKIWWTDSPDRAAVLHKYAAPEIALDLERIARSHVDSLEASRAKDADLAVPAPEGLEYMPFQRAGIAYAQSRAGVLYGDEMGLGKTIEAIGLVNLDLSIRSVLVICPASLKVNWWRELDRWLVEKRTIGIADAQSFPFTDIVIVNYDVLRRYPDTHRLYTQTWDLLVADEAHFMKNEKAQRSQAVRKILARRRVLMTGTPIVNCPRELWNLINYLDPKTWGHFWTYAKRYCNAFQDRRGHWDLSGAANLEELQRKLRETVMVRRLKSEVLTELPPKVRQVLPVECDDPSILQAEAKVLKKNRAAMESMEVALELAKADGEEAFRAAVDRLQKENGIAFQDLARVRHETALVKVTAAREILEEAGEASAKLVIFAHHHDVIDQIVDIYQRGTAVKLTGEMTLAARQASVDRFQRDAGVRVFVGSIQSAGVGLTLTASSHVIFMEEDWVPGNISQAEDRLHRIGQKDSVLVQHLVIDGSIDAKMAKTMVEKQRVIEKAMDKPCDLVLPEVDTPKVRPIRSTVSELAKEAETLTAEAIAAIHQGLKYLAGVCDGARDLDGSGFNRFDTQIGKSLAERPALTSGQAALGRKLVNKYRGQLPEELVAAAKGRAA